MSTWYATREVADDVKLIVVRYTVGRRLSSGHCSSASSERRRTRGALGLASPCTPAGHSRPLCPGIWKPVEKRRPENCQFIDGFDLRRGATRRCPWTPLVKSWSRTSATPSSWKMTSPWRHADVRRQCPYFIGWIAHTHKTSATWKSTRQSQPHLSGQYLFLLVFVFFCVCHFFRFRFHSFLIIHCFSARY